jgi:hypothetical protein
VKPDPFDVLGALGLLLLAGGLWMVYPPLALIVPGALLVLISAAGAWRRGGG